jgi:glycosyltransferase involved in cell wall biosynthesis
MQGPRISACIPTHNGARYLDACLESVRQQTHDDIEILVLDDRSSDDTLSIARAHARADGRIRIEQNPTRLGLAGNWNRCIELAVGDWIKFVFQDDLIDHRCIKQMLKAADAHPGAAMIACYRRIIFEGVDEATERIYRQYTAEHSLAGVFPGETEISARRFCDAVLDLSHKNFVGEPTGLLLHKTAFEKFGYFNEHLISLCDWEFWIRLGIHTGLVIVPETLATFRVHGAGTSINNVKERTYRLKSIDPLILLHAMAFDEAFAPLRSAAAARQPRMDLGAMFASRAWLARRLATRGRLLGRHDREWMREWRATAALYPRVETSFDVRKEWLIRTLRFYRRFQSRFGSRRAQQLQQTPTSTSARSKSE